MICFSIRVLSSGSASSLVFSQWLTFSGLSGFSLAAIFSMFMIGYFSGHIYTTNLPIIIPQRIPTKNISVAWFGIYFFIGKSHMEIKKGL